MTIRTSRITGAREMDRVLKQLPRQIGVKVLRGATMAGAQVIRKAALEKLGGAERGDVIARSVRGGKASATVAVGPPGTKFFLMFREFGTGPHAIKAGARRGGKLLADRESGAVFGPAVQHPGQAARPFLRPAFDANVRRALDKIGEILGRRIEKAASKLAGSFAQSGLKKKRRRR